MKKWLYIIAAILFQVQLVSCMDDQLVDSQESNMTSLKIVLNIPVENAQSRGFIYGPDEGATELESTINDIYILGFNSSNTCLGKFQSSYANNALLAQLDVSVANIGEITVMVIANLAEQENGTALVSALDNMEGKSKTQVLKELEYNFSGTAWDISTRPIPMWGETTITPIEGKIVNGAINLYRSVSKINVSVNKGQGITNGGTDVFKLNSVRVYYARTSGLAGSLHAPVTNPEGSPTIIQTSMPDNVSYMPRYDGGGTTNGILYEATPNMFYTIENKIYVPEVQQPGEEPMCLVIGGYYMGSTQETFYRVDFKEGNTGSEYYDALRNHIYNFDITNVTRPGTDDPDPALDHVVVGMEITIQKWTTVYMRGIGEQYTLEVEAGGVYMEATNTAGSNLWVESTHNEGWDVESAAQVGTWFTVTKTSTGVLITPTNENAGGQRRGSFVITSGNLRKVIMVRQKGKGTANCYVVSDDGTQMLQDLIVTVKGNGEDGLISDGKPLNDQEPNIAPADVKIIWETAEGLITLVTNPDGTTKINADGIVQYKVDLTKKNPNIVSSNQNIQGGNALIGAFDENDNILWTWHIWVCPDMDTSPTDGIISDTEIEANLENWSTGYTFMDRNLGALSNKPGLASLGLLYQWGRKDPFIGAGAIAHNAPKMSTENLVGFPWGSTAGSLTVEQARRAPTTLSEQAISGTDYALLWGTDKGFDPNGERDAGNKTIYDPCPVGYRIPPVGSVVFKRTDGTSEYINWNYNNRYWPNNESAASSSYNYIDPSATDSYGFWVNLLSSADRPTISTYSSSNQTNDTEVANATWLPVAGVYDGTMNEFAFVDNQYSVTVNSIMWTNSSINAGGVTRPGALFLHGAENLSVAGSGYRNGRHLHKLIETSNNLYAKPSHAGSVRCIKDEKSSIVNSIKVPATIHLGAAQGSTVIETLVSITETWEVIDPGASWFTMTPDEGGTGSAQTITFTATATNNGEQREADLLIRFSDGTVKTITVIQYGIVSPTDLSFAGYNGYWNRPTAQLVSISYSGTWSATSNDADWLHISTTNTNINGNNVSSSGTTLYVQPTTNFWMGSPRTGTITVTLGSTTVTIHVSQGTNAQ